MKSFHDYLGLSNSCSYDVIGRADRFRFQNFCSPGEYSSVFRENRCPPPPKPVYGRNFIHQAVTLKIRSRSPKSNKLLILSDLYKLANLVTFQPMVHEITCRQTLFGLILVDYVWQWPWKLDQGHQNLFSFLSFPNVMYMQIWLKSASRFMRYCAHKHLLAQIWQFKPHSDLENRSRSPKPISSSSCPYVISMQIWLKSANQFMTYGAHKHFFGLNLAVEVPQWPWKLCQGHQNLINSLLCIIVTSMQIWLKSTHQFTRYVNKSDTLKPTPLPTLTPRPTGSASKTMSPSPSVGNIKYQDVWILEAAYIWR